MGEAPEVRGFFLGCGFNSAGKGRKRRTLAQDGNVKTSMDAGKRDEQSHDWPVTNYQRRQIQKPLCSTLKLRRQMSTVGENERPKITPALLNGVTAENYDHRRR